MKIKNIILSVALLTVFLVGPAFAGKGKDRPEGFQKKHEKMEKSGHEIFDKLNLTDEQKSKLEKNKKDGREQGKALFEKMRKLKESMQAELMKTEPDTDQLKSINAEIKAAQAAMEDNRLESILRVRKILTPEQFSQFLSMTKEHSSDRSHKEKK